MLILTVFNSVFWGFFGCFLLLLVIAMVLLKNRSEQAKVWTLVLFMTGAFIAFWAYKFGLSHDTEYAGLRAAAGYGTGTFTWWDELPLQLCNINMVIMPIALLKKDRGLLGFCTFLGPIGALLAVLMPPVGFEGYSLLLPRMWGFYGTHFAIFVGALAILFMGLYRPTFKEIPRIVANVVIISFVIFCINMLLRVTGLNPYANYFYNVSTEGNSILELFHSVIPVPFLYQLGCLVILVPYMLIVTSLVTLFTREKKPTK